MREPEKLDGQLVTHGESYSYAQEGFAEFYDLMVDKLKDLIGAGPDIDLYYQVLQKALEASPSKQLKLLELCTGSGRVVIGLLDRLFRDAEQLPKGFRLEVTGVDHSAEMLAAAARKVGTLLGNLQEETWLQTPAPAWVRQSIAELDLPELRGSCDVVLLLAGSFHHLLTRAEQQAALRGIREHLSADPPGWAVLSLFGRDEIDQAEFSKNDVFEVGPFKRRQLSLDIRAMPDGGMVATSRFELTHTPNSAAPPQLTTAGALPAALAAEAAPEAGAAMMPEVRHEEWSLRVVSHAEFRELAAAAGLRVVSEHLEPNLAAPVAAEPTSEGKRYFVLRAA